MFRKVALTPSLWSLTSRFRMRSGTRRISKSRVDLNGGVGGDVSARMSVTSLEKI